VIGLPTQGQIHHLASVAVTFRPGSLSSTLLIGFEVFFHLRKDLSSSPTRLRRFEIASVIDVSGNP
jgi:hypothetical protein